MSGVVDEELEKGVVWRKSNQPYAVHASRPPKRTAEQRAYDADWHRRMKEAEKAAR